MPEVFYQPCGCRGADLYAMSQCLSVPPIKEADGRNISAHPAELLRCIYFSALSGSKLVAGETVAVRLSLRAERGILG
jgi:hypothetical protein